MPVKDIPPNMEMKTGLGMLACRHLEICVEETAAAIFGKGKSLKEAVPASANWKKVSE